MVKRNCSIYLILLRIPKYVMTDSHADLIVSVWYCLCKWFASTSLKAQIDVMKRKNCKVDGKDNVEDANLQAFQVFHHPDDFRPVIVWKPTKESHYRITYSYLEPATRIPVPVFILKQVRVNRGCVLDVSTESPASTYTAWLVAAGR